LGGGPREATREGETGGWYAVPGVATRKGQAGGLGAGPREGETGGLRDLPREAPRELKHRAATTKPAEAGYGDRGMAALAP
jgi:hypothetical protein